MLAVGCGEPLPSEPGAEAALTTEKQALQRVQVAEAVAGGASHSLYLRKNGEVWAWGQNTFGQLGTGAATSTPQPIRVTALPAVKAIAAGLTHSLALDVDGNVWAWGQNASGQVGLGTAGGTVLLPVKVTSLSAIQAIAANGSFSLALGLDGRVWAWGQNTFGQVGTGSTTPAAVASPVTVAGLPTIRAIAAGHNHVLALDADGRVWGWGQNNAGQVGTGATSSTPVLFPTQVVRDLRATAIAAGAAHSLLIQESSGNVWAWGQNTFGQVGAGSTSTTPVVTPSPVSGTFAATAIAAGHSFSLIIMGGFTKAWGQNAFGQLGDGTTVNRAAPVNAAGMTETKAIAAGSHHALAVRPGCPVWGWGNNGQGQLGTGTASNAAHPNPLQSLVTHTYYFDSDMDGFGDEFFALDACEAPEGFVEELDCDDYTPTTYPEAPEACNGVDDSCDGAVDEGNPSGGESCSTGRQGVCAAGTTACTNGSVVCEQNQAASDEQCDSLDNDCDGEVDDGNPGGLQECAAGGQGVCAEGVTYCTHGAIECVQKQGPSPEVCDSRDNDCNGQSDDGLTFQTWYLDQDGDNYGVAAQATQACSRPNGYAPNAGDCNDASAALNPGAAEVCDGVDNDCDSQADEGLSTLAWYRDADGDGFGTASDTVQSCRQPTGYVAASGDCNDTSASIKPGGTETCDGLDNDCDSQVDDGLMSAWYRDADEDGYGNPSQSTQACAKPSGYVASPGDCNDSNVSIKPGATEVCDSVDNNCSGAVDEGLTTQTWYRDADGDTHGTLSDAVQKCSQPSGYVANANDCNDANASIRPGGTEVCDTLDNNCNGTTDEGVQSTFYRDADGDGYGTTSSPAYACVQPAGHVTNASDCNDSSASIRPGGTEVCDGVDNNCSGTTDEGVTSTFYRDADGDGYGTSGQSTQACSAPSGYVSNTSDCNDSSASIRPGGTEVCDGADNNCNGTTDEGVQATFYRDADGDGYGSAGLPTAACGQPSGYVSNASDCNDGSADIRPGATEVCDGADNNCNGTADEGVKSTFYRDADGDGYGTSSPSTQACSAPSGYVSNTSDCNDSNASIRPGGTEVCDGADNNCNGSTDEGVKSTFYRDADGDGYGNVNSSTQACSAPSGYVSNTSDCNDGYASIRPGAAEACDGVDNNCNGSTDEGVQSTFYRDADGDGYGTSSPTTQACSAPSGYVSNTSDCNDSNASIRPGGTEVCDGADNNCNGSTDEGVKSTFYRDADGDGYGNVNSPTQACSAPSGYVSNTSDCNDGYASIRPGAAETCDGVDNNCNGSTDEGVQAAFYRDADGDGYGNPSSPAYACGQPSGYVTNASDCNDGSAGIRPGATEVCDGVDNNCSGQADEGAGTTWYPDGDGDGYGDAYGWSQPVTSCSQPAGYVSNGLDCNDGYSSIRPGASDPCDGWDNNCDGMVDENSPYLCAITDLPY